MLPWVLLPGTLCTGKCFTSTLVALAAEGIEPPTNTIVPGDNADPVEEAKRLCREAPERFVVCAFSLGGIIAFQAALAAPERIAGMILISVTGRADQADNRAARLAQVEWARRASAATLVRESLWPNYVAAGSLGNHDLRREIEAMASCTNLQRFANQAEIAIVRPDVIEALGNVRIPTLVINGEEDVATPPERGAEVARALTNGKQALIADAGHFVLMERATATAAEIAKFMRSSVL